MLPLGGRNPVCRIIQAYVEKYFLRKHNQAKIKLILLTLVITSLKKNLKTLFRTVYKITLQTAPTTHRHIYHLADPVSFLHPLKQEKTTK